MWSNHSLPTRGELAKLALIAGVTFVTVFIAIQSTTLSAGQMAIWPPDGIALAMMLGPLHRRPLLALLVCQLSASAAGGLLGDSLSFILLLKVAGATLVYVLYRILRGLNYDTLAHRSDNIIRLFVLSLFGSLLVAVMQTWIVTLFYKVTFISVYLSDAAANWVGYAVLTPTFLIMTAHKWRVGGDPATIRRLAKIVAVYLLVVVGIFCQSRFPLLFLLPLALMAVGYTTSIATVACCILATTVIAIACTLTGHGPLMAVTGAATDRMLMLQIVLGVVTATELPIAALMAEHANLKQSLVAARIEAEAASQAKSSFLATLSHEIRTPLNAVTSAAHLLGRTELTPEQEEHVSILLTGSEVLLSLINDVLDMSKIEAGKLSAEFGDVDIQDLAGKLTALWTPKAVERGLTLELVIPPDLPAAIRTDPLRLNQILFNLLSNAVKFTAPGGVRVVVSEVHGGPESRGAIPAPRLRFEVIDSGAGMTDEVMSRLFRSFEQADSGVALRHGGTGLGLAISRKLAELLGGELTVRSAPGEGSTFTLEIPLIVAAVKAPVLAPAGEADRVEAQPGRALSILLAEDHPVNRRLVDLILRPMGWELTMVENGAEAVEAATLRPFDVILLDMQMPVMSGIEAARAIKAGGGPNAVTPLAALTANAFEDQRADWEAAGAAAFLTKPLNPAVLIEAVIALAEAGADPAARRARAS